MERYWLAATVPDSRFYLDIRFNHHLTLKHEVLESAPSESPEHEVFESVPSESPDHDVLEGAPFESPEHEVVEGTPSLPIFSPTFPTHFTNSPLSKRNHWAGTGTASFKSARKVSN